MADEARALLGASSFEAVARRVEMLPSRVDRDGVWCGLAATAYGRKGHALLDPTYTRDRDETRRGVERALAKYRRVLERKALGAEVEPVEEALRAVRDPKGPRFVERAKEATRRKLLREDRRSVGWEPEREAGGRPRAPWLDEGRAMLRAAGCTAEETEALLDAAGLKATRQAAKP